MDFQSLLPSVSSPVLGSRLQDEASVLGVGHVLAIALLATHLTILSVELCAVLDPLRSGVVLGVVSFLLLLGIRVCCIITSTLALSGARLALTGGGTLH